MKTIPSATVDRLREEADSRVAWKYMQAVCSSEQARIVGNGSTKSRYP